MVLVQKWDFFHLFILGKIGRKNAFLDYKNKKLKNKKIGLFSKGLVHGFALKMEFFPPFYFWQNRQEKVFGHILERASRL